MSRRHTNARQRHLGARTKPYRTPEVGYSHPQETPLMLSSGVASAAKKELARREASRSVARFASSVIDEWAKPASPVTAKEFWSKNSLLESSDPKFAPTYFRTNLGEILGWGVVTHRRAEVSGGKLGESLPAFAPIRMEAGKVAYDALLKACGDEETMYQALCQPIPEFITAVNADERNPKLNPPSFRLSQYPTVGTIRVNLVGRSLDIGFNFNPLLSPPPSGSRYDDYNW